MRKEPCRRADTFRQAKGNLKAFCSSRLLPSDRGPLHTLQKGPEAHVCRPVSVPTAALQT